MKTYVLRTFTAAAILFPVFAGAQTTVIETGPPPDEVITYVQRETHPSVRVEGDVAVGFTLPSTVELRPVPRHDRYSFTVINNRRVIVEPRTRRVIRVID